MDIVPMGQMKPFIAMRIAIDVCIYNTHVCVGDGVHVRMWTGATIMPALF